MSVSTKERAEARKSSARKFVDTPPGRERTSIKPPQGFEMLKLKPGTHKVDFLPYIVKSKFNRRADRGHTHFEREYEVHRIPSASGSTDVYVCRRVAFGEKCAACDWLTRNGNSADEKLVKSLRGSTRNLYLVNDTPSNHKNKLKIFDQAYYGSGNNGFGQQLAKAIQTLDEDADPFGLKNGYSAILTVETIHAGTFKYDGVTRIDLRERKEDYDKSVLLEGILDDCLIDPGYEKIEALLTSGGSGDEEPEEPEEEAESETEEEEEEEDDKSSKVRKPSTDDDEEDEEDLDSDLEDWEDESGEEDEFEEDE